MSYDLMVFDPIVAPSDRAAFLAWYETQAEWAEGHSYDDPSVTTEPLRAWFFDMIKDFPAMNGPHASQDYDDERVSDYSIGRSVIYVAFAWSQAEPAFAALFDKARKHGVGFYNVSGERGEVWLPRGKELVCVHSGD
jgi:hypothetical protein